MARPRRRYTGTGQPKTGVALPPGVKAGVLADQLAGATLAETAAAFGLDKSTVSRLAATLQGIDPAAIGQIERGLPRMYAVLASKFGTAASQALDQGDLPNATKAAFGSKLSVEAGRLSQPQAEAPGVMMLTFVQQITPQPERVVSPAERLCDERLALSGAAGSGAGAVSVAHPGTLVAPDDPLRAAGDWLAPAPGDRPTDTVADPRGSGHVSGAPRGERAGVGVPPAPLSGDEQGGQDAQEALEAALGGQVSDIAGLEAHDRAECSPVVGDAR